MAKSLEAQLVGAGAAPLKAVTDRVPDLIILDLDLPVVGGLEVCRILRSRWATDSPIDQHSGATRR